MPKDNRKILRTVRISGKSPTGIVSSVQKFSPGDEDELAAVLTPEQGAAYLASGAIEGEWKFTGGSQAEAPPIDDGKGKAPPAKPPLK